MELSLISASSLSAKFSCRGLATCSDAQIGQPVALSRSVTFSDRRALLPGPVDVWVKTKDGIAQKAWTDLSQDIAASLRNRAMMDRGALLSRHLHDPVEMGETFRTTFIQGAVLVGHRGIITPMIPDGNSAHDKIKAINSITSFLPLWNLHQKAQASLGEGSCP